MRYYLDTNILAYMLSNRWEEITSEVEDIIKDYSNILLTSSVCVQELIQLFHIGKLTFGKNDRRDATNVLEWIKQNGIKIVYVNELHLEEMAAMPALHNDPFDRLIVAQGIADRIAVVSSDAKFKSYRRFGLQFVFNKR